MAGDERANAVAARRERCEKAWELGDGVVLVGAGYPIPIPGGADQCFEYRSHPEYFWLTECERPGSVAAFDPGSGWTHFVPPLTELERVWEGEHAVPPGAPLEELEAWLGVRAGRPVALLGGEIRGVRGDDALSRSAREQLTHARRAKDSLEISRMRRAAAATAAGHARASTLAAPGITERELEIELEAAFARAGADRPGYDTIVGTGPNSAVFHFAPSRRALGEDEIVLVDAGAEIERYVADVTRVYPAREFSSRQRELYDVLRSVQERAIQRCRPGFEWREAHRGAARDIAEGLVSLGLMRGDPAELAESGAAALFFPHGIGHMVGLGVRDAGGSLPGRDELPRVCGVVIRADLPLERGYVMTVEPGIYFVPALLDSPERRKRFAGAVCWDALEAWRSIGGMRLEDNVLVTAGEPEVLTADIPR